MQNDNTQPAQTDKNISFGSRLKAAREAMGLERKDVAAQLRLNEKFLVMMEKDSFSSDLPLTFARGYLKTYAKFLQISDFETKKALETLKPRPGTQDNMPLRNLPQITTSNYFMQLFTYLVIFTMIGLAGAWWYTHPNLPSEILAENSFTFNKQAADKAKSTANATAHAANATQVPANMPITATQSNPPQSTVTVNTDPNIDPISASPGETTATNKTMTNNAATITPDVDIDADATLNPTTTTNPSTPAANTHAQAAKKAPAYMSTSNDDPLDDKSNDTE